MPALVPAPASTRLNDPLSLQRRRSGFRPGSCTPDYGGLCRAMLLPVPFRWPHRPIERTVGREAHELTVDLSCRDPSPRTCTKCTTTRKPTARPGPPGYTLAGGLRLSPRLSVRYLLCGLAILVAGTRVTPSIRPRGARSAALGPRTDRPRTARCSIKLYSACPDGRLRGAADRIRR